MSRDTPPSPRQAERIADADALIGRLDKLTADEGDPEELRKLDDPLTVFERKLADVESRLARLEGIK